MLVLTRKAGEAVRIGDEVRVVVLSASGGQVRLGIEAPADRTVLREEILESVASANRDAALRPGERCGEEAGEAGRPGWRRRTGG